MTCIVGIKCKDNIYIGGDSASSDGNTITVRADDKVFAIKTDGGDEFIYGFTSSYRMGQILRHCFVPPAIPTPCSESALDHYMVRVYMPALQKALEDNKWLKQDSNISSGGQFIIGTHQRLYTIHSDFQIDVARSNYCAVGSGSALALGSLYTTSQLKELDPIQRITMALMAATEHDPFVRPPYIIELLTPDRRN